MDDCGTIQKTYYTACFARAVRNKGIDSNMFFKLSHCIRSLTEEDFLLLKKSITTNVIDSDEDYIEDFRALGLMRDVDGRFAYTKRAFELNKYALDYEGKVEIPDHFPERFRPITSEPISEDEIQDIVNKAYDNNKPELIEEARSKREKI